MTGMCSLSRRRPPVTLMARPGTRSSRCVPGWRCRGRVTTTVRAEHRETPDLDKLTELLIRFALQDSGEQRAARARERGAMARASDPS